MKTDIDITDHTRWRLQLTAGENVVRANYYDAAASRIFTYMEKRWQGDPAEALRKIEDAVYDDPVVVDDYDTSILIRPSRLLLVETPDDPSALEDEAPALIAAVDARENKDVWVESLPGGVTAVYSTPTGVRDFLGRTFPTEDVHLALRPLLQKALDTFDSRGERVWVHLDGSTLDIVALRDGVPALLNTREYAEPADAVYYIVYALRALEFNAADCEVRVSGAEELRRAVLPMLRRHLDMVSSALLSTVFKQAVNSGVSMCEILNSLKQ